MISYTFKVKSFSKKFLNSVTFENASEVSLPKKVKKVTVNRSSHVNNKSKDQFVMEVYSKLLVIKNMPQNLLDKIFYESGDYSGVSFSWVKVEKRSFCS